MNECMWTKLLGVHGEDYNNQCLRNKITPKMVNMRHLIKDWIEGLRYLRLIGEKLAAG